MIARFPKLSINKAIARGIWPELQNDFIRADTEGYEILHRRPVPDLEGEFFGSSGLPRLTHSDLVRLREALDAAMFGVVGFPENVHISQEVDRALCRTLGSLGLPIGEMLRKDVWCWICVHLMPHYVYWRWWNSDNGSISQARVMGLIVRNALGRLWLRATVLDLGAENEGRWRLLDRMPEDACSALLERTTISSNHRLSRALIDAWLRASEGMPSTQAEKLLRTAMVRARVQASVIETSVLDDNELMHVVMENFK